MRSVTMASLRVVVGSAAAAVASAAASAPNFIWIMSDDLGYGEISAMPGRNNTNITTPNIDALFHSGTTFTDAYCGEAVCAPSRGSLMTAKHTGHATIRGNIGGKNMPHGLPLAANDTTVLNVMQDNGYHVACIGKWGMGWVDDTGAPHLKGCNEYFGVLDQNYAHNMYPFLANYTWQYPASDGSLKYESISYPNNANASREYCMSAGNNCTWSHDLWTNAALAFLERQAVIQAEARARGEAAQPFFLYLAYTDPHAGGWTGTDELGNPVPSDGIFGNASLTWPDPERDHASVIQNFQDRDVGRVVDALEKGGIRDSTAVFFASDNGASNEGNHDYSFFGSSGPLRGFKRCLTEGGIRTAFAVSWPGTIPANVTTNYTVAFWDMMPTIAEMAGIPNSALPNDIDGISVWPAIMGNSDAPVHPPLYWEFCTAVHPPGTIKQNATAVGWGHAVRMGKWKGVSLFWGEPLSLYNLETDIGELNDVSADHADIVAEMAAYAKSAHVDSVYFPTGDDCASS